MSSKYASRDAIAITNADTLDGYHASAFVLVGAAFGNADTLDGLHKTDFVYLSDYTAADILSKLLTVDGTGSLLDADKLDGAEGALYARLASPAFTGIISTARTAGQPSIKATVDAGGSLVIDSNGGQVYLNSYVTDNVILAYGGGKVGILKDNPAYPLDVLGIIRTDGASNGIYLRNGFTSEIVNPNNNTRDIQFNQDAAASVFFKGNGNVGFGTVSGLGKISINGGLHIGGDSDAGDDNLIVDGTALISGIATFNDDLIGNEAFVSGFMGSGWKLDKNTDYSLTVDNLTVRKLMRVYELEINKINSVNGGIMVSVANGKAYSVEVINFDTWHPTGAWTTLTLSGLDITAANNASGQKDIVVSKTPINYPTSAQVPWLAGEDITFTCTLTYTSGAYPSILISENGSVVVNQALAAGVNTVTYTTVTAGSNNYIGLRVTGAAVFTLTSVSCPFLHANKIIFDEDESTAGTGNIIQFEKNDYIRAQEWTGRGVDYYQGKVLSVIHSDTLGSAYIRVESIYDCWEGADLVQVGNLTEADRQNMIYITASDDNNPYIQMVSGVTDGNFSGHTKVMLGNLKAIESTGIVPANPGYGLFCDNVYLTGKLILPTAGMTDEGAVATSIRLYAGATYANRTTAPFRVTQDGSLTSVGNSTLGSATGQVDLGLTGDRGTVNAWSSIIHYGGKRNWSYSVQNDLGLTAIEYSCYRLDTADVAKTLTLPSDAQMNNYLDATIILVNPTKANFTINSNSVPVYLNVAASVTSFVLAEGESCTLIYIDHGTNPGWYLI